MAFNLRIFAILLAFLTTVYASKEARREPAAMRSFHKNLRVEKSRQDESVQYYDTGANYDDQADPNQPPTNVRSPNVEVIIGSRRLLRETDPSSSSTSISDSK